MKTFIRSVLLFLIPFILMAVLYLILDPFKVMYHYEAFYPTHSRLPNPLNRDYISTTIFDNRYKTEKYDSFIFGNSRSEFFEISDWKQHIPRQSSCYHFVAAGETLFGMYKKFQYVDKKGVIMKNAIIVLDNSLLSYDRSKPGSLFIISPQLVDYSNWLDFQATFLKAAFSPKFIAMFIESKFSDRYTLYRTHDLITNEFYFFENERLIKENKYYTPERMSVFYTRAKIPSYSPPAIKASQARFLTEMAAILKKHRTQYKIIINPLYNQIKISRKDLDFIKRTFGEKNVSDYSGINKFTEDYRNYYEDSHFRPVVARQIMSEIYSTPRQSGLK